MKPELRVFLLKDCIVNPPPAPPAPAKPATFAPVVPLLGLVLPKVIEAGLGGIAMALKKAGAVDVEQVTAAEITYLYKTDESKQLSINPDLGCVIGAYGVFADQDRKPTPPGDTALKALEGAGLIPRDADITIVFEAAIVPTKDETAFYLELRHFSVRDFIGRRRKPERMYAVTLSVAAPSATAEGTTVALGNMAIGRVGRETLPIGPGVPLGTFPRYRTNLMPWNRMTADAKEAYESDVRRNAVAANSMYMPVTFNLTLSETAAGNKFLAAFGELLEGAKSDAAKQISGLIIPEDGAKAAKAKADAAEQLYQHEEDADIAVKEAEAALAAGKPEERPVLEAKLAKARRALEVAGRLRKAARLPDLNA